MGRPRSGTRHTVQCTATVLREKGRSIWRPSRRAIPASGRAAPQTKPGRLRILTANTLLFPWPFYSDQAERIAEFAKLARSVSPDIIFLQEVWDNNSLRLLLARFPDYHAVIAPNPLFNLGGLMIFSRIAPVRATAESFPLTLNHNPEELIARKGILWAEISCSGRQIWLATTHLYSSAAKARVSASHGTTVSGLASP